MKIEVTYPESWTDIKYSQYSKYYKQIKPYEGTDELPKMVVDQGALNFCKVPAEHLYQLPTEAINKIATVITNLVSNTKLPLVKTFTVDNTEYGFMPNIEEMSYGEYLDLTTYFKDMWNNIPIIMSILYRPITKQLGKTYEIEAYTGTNDDRIELFKHVLTMDIVWGAIAFFLDLQKDLLIGTQIYLQKELKNLTKGNSTVKMALMKNGVDTTQLQFLQEMTSLNLTMLQDSQYTNV